MSDTKKIGLKEGETLRIRANRGRVIIWLTGDASLETTGSAELPELVYQDDLREIEGDAKRLHRKIAALRTRR